MIWEAVWESPSGRTTEAQFKTKGKVGKKKLMHLAFKKLRGRDMRKDEIEEAGYDLFKSSTKSLFISFFVGDGIEASHLSVYPAEDGGLS